MCKAFLAQLRRVYPELQSLGVQVVAVTMGYPDQTEVFCQEQNAPFVCLSDHTREAYEAFGLRISRVGASHPTSWLAFAREILKGNLPGPPPPGSSSAQLSGAFIIDRQGIVRHAHQSQTASDFPTAEAILEAVRRLPQVAR